MAQKFVVAPRNASGAFFLSATAQIAFLTLVVWPSLPFVEFFCWSHGLVNRVHCGETVPRITIGGTKENELATRTATEYTSSQRNTISFAMDEENGGDAPRL